MADKLLLLLLLLSRFSRVPLCNPIGSSPPGSPVPGILQERTLEWVAISFSNACMHAKSLRSCPTMCDPMDSRAHQAPLSMEFSRQEYWSGLPFPSLDQLSGGQTYEEITVIQSLKL